MNLKDFFSIYPSIDSPEFNQKIYDKHEFLENKIVKDEDEVISKGEYYKSQKIIRNFMNGYNNYDSLLLYHSMGTGKTCTSIATAEHLLTNKIVKKVVIISRGENLLRNFQRELVMVCTNGKYIPSTLVSRNGDLYKDNNVKITDNEFYRQTKKLYSRNYEFDTYYKFAGRIERRNDFIQSKYENCLFILDEVHNMKFNEDVGNVEKMDVYKIFLNLFNNLTTRHVLLLSGTPMVNNANEIANILNLLHKNSPCPTGIHFDNKFLKNDKFNNDSSMEFDSLIKGKVSYLKNKMDDSVEIIHKGIIGKELEYYKVVESKMSEYQSKLYHDNLKMDIDNPDIFAKSQQASNITITDMEMDIVLKKMDTALSIKNKLSLVRKYSCKFASIIKNVLDNPTKNTFIYSIFIEYGVNQLVKFLQKFGFSQASTTYNLQPKKRFLLITSKSNSNTTRKLLKIYNSPENKNGELIQCIIGSETVSEGYSFMNVQHIHILSPNWNYAKIDQAIYRGIRLNSHKDLKDNVKVEIFKHVAKPLFPVQVDGVRQVPIGLTKCENSIDLYMYSTAERKDKIIKSIDKQIIKSCVDCQLVKDRNTLPSLMDFSRECNFSKCDYDCNGIEDVEPMTDFSTYNVYFFDEYYQSIINDITRLFQTNTSVDVKDLDYPEYQVYNTIYYMMNENVIIRNKNGIPSLLRIEQNLLFLIVNMDTFILNNFYNNNIIINDVISIQELSEYNKTINDKNILNEFQQTTTIEGKKQLFKKLSVQKQSHLVERLLTYSTSMKNLVMDYYKGYIFKDDGKLFHNILKTKFLGEIRCLDEKNKWINCLGQNVESNVINKYFFETFANVSKNYGIITIDDVFLIRDISNLKKMNQIKGKNATSYNLKDLTTIADRIDSIDSNSVLEHRMPKNIFIKLIKDYFIQNNLIFREII
jgi:hypothetical protein